jgi:3-methylfumaryl-CoA hydratase
MSDTLPDFREWIGRTETLHDALSAEHAQRAAATFDGQVTGVTAGSPLPPLWHWFFFLPQATQRALDVDGHPQRGGFLPPIPFPRRMFAGARVTWHHPIRIAEPAIRLGTIRDVVLKSGRSGSLAFVTVRYEITQHGTLCLEEEQDIVYRQPGAAVAAPDVHTVADTPDGAWRRTITPDPRLLFRFSALTFNAHRIHYDRPYARDEEGYPGLVVHGPLTAMLLVDLVTQHTSRALASFSFRGLAPLFDLAPFHLVARPSDTAVDLEAVGPDLTQALTAQVTFR